MLQAEVQNPNLPIILHLSLIKLTQVNKFWGIIKIKTLFKGFLFSACDLTAWAREVMRWTSIEEKLGMQIRISLQPFKIEP